MKSLISAIKSDNDLAICATPLQVQQQRKVVERRERYLKDGLYLLDEPEGVFVRRGERAIIHEVRIMEFDILRLSILRSLNRFRTLESKAMLVYNNMNWILVIKT